MFNQYILEEISAAFIGMVIGDALGAAVEFMTASEIAAKYGTFRDLIGGDWLHLKPGQMTDDTETALCIGPAIVKNHGWSLETVADNFAVWLKSRPVDCGDTCYKGIRAYMLKRQIESLPNEWDAGNGAAMRVLPAALFSFPDGVAK
jgi:ADP-ribosyl-[dinitrogen reductase] hydrolase